MELLFAHLAFDFTFLQVLTKEDKICLAYIFQALTVSTVNFCDGNEMYDWSEILLGVKFSGANFF